MTLHPSKRRLLKMCDLAPERHRNLDIAEIVKSNGGETEGNDGTRHGFPRTCACSTAGPMYAGPMKNGWKIWQRRIGTELGRGKDMGNRRTQLGVSGFSGTVKVGFVFTPTIHAVAHANHPRCCAKQGQKMPGLGLHIPQWGSAGWRHA